MFDNTKPNVIILTDFTDVLTLSKTIGPYKVAHELRCAGFEVAVVDHLHVFSYDELLNCLSQLISDRTLFVGVSSFFYQCIDNPVTREDGGTEYRSKQYGAFLPHGIHKNKEFKKFIRKCNPNCKIVMGGPDAQDLPYAQDFDYVVKGYGDCAVVNLANHLLDKNIKLKKSYKSIYGPVVINDSKAENFDFANSVMRYAEHDIILPGETLVVEVARGCIFNCVFCSFPLNGKKKLDFIKYEENLYQEFLDNFERFNVTRYIFSDDTFNDTREKIEMIHRVSKRLPFNLEYWCYLRLDLLTAHPDTIDLLAESGWRSGHFGIETFNERSASLIGKGGSREKQIETLSLIKKKYGDQILIGASFILGLPEESLESCKKTLAWISSDHGVLDTASVFAMTLHFINSQSEFASAVEKNPEKYGYSFPDEQDQVSGSFLSAMARNWRNDYMDFETASRLESEFLKKRVSPESRFKMPGVGAFGMAGLGIDLDLFFTTPLSKLPWHKISLAKDQRVQEYKNKFYKVLNIKKLEEALIL